MSDTTSPGLLLSRRTRRHSVLFGLNTIPLLVMGGYVLGMVVLGTMVQQLGVFVAALVGAVVLYFAMREPLRMD